MMDAIMVMILILMIYFTPAVFGSDKKNALSIFALNLFLGWTFIGWVIALVWALRKDK